MSEGKAVSEEKGSDARRSIPLPVKAAIFLAVLVLLMAPFVLSGTVASWAALGIVALTFVAAVVAVGFDLFELGRPSSSDSGTDGGTDPRRLLTVGAAVLALVVFGVWRAQQAGDDDPAGPPEVSEQQLQKAQEALRNCDTPACAVRALGGGKKPKAPGGGG